MLLTGRKFEPEYGYVVINNGQDKKIIEKIVVGIIYLVFLGFSIYTLAVSNTKDVEDNCGTTLWQFMLVRLIFYIIEGFIVMFWGTALMCIMGSCPCLERWLFSIIMIYIPFLLVIILHGFFVGIGLNDIQAVVGNSLCIDTLSNVSFTKSPLLTIFGYVYVSLDVFVLFVLTFGGIYVACRNVALVNYGSRDMNEYNYFEP
jgi:hypothetical protein